MTNTCAIPQCGKPSPDGAVCRPCIDHLDDKLSRVEEIADELTTTLMRQHRTTPPSEIRPPGTHSPMPFDVRASAALSGLSVTLARTCAYLRGRLADDPKLGARPADVHPGTVATWVRLRRFPLGRTERGAQLVDQLIGDVDHALEVIDRGPDVAYLGPCVECGRSLYSEDAATLAVCRCGYSEGVVDARARATKVAGATQVTAKQAASVLPTLTGRPVPVGTVKSWFSRREVPISVSADGVAVAYVADLAQKVLTGRARKAGKP